MYIKKCIYVCVLLSLSCDTSLDWNIINIAGVIIRHKLSSQSENQSVNIMLVKTYTGFILMYIISNYL